MAPIVTRASNIVNILSLSEAIFHLMAEFPRFIVLSTGETIPLAALEFSTSRSGGPGGQNVNKVETRVEVRFTPAEATWLQEEARERLIEGMAGRLDSAGRLRVVSSSERTQRGNRVAALERLTTILNGALRRKPPRMPTRPTHASRIHRIESKRKASEKKEGRRWRPD